MNNEQPHKDFIDSNGRILAAVGLNLYEERAYLLLLDQPGLTQAELTRVLELPERVTGSYLSMLESKGLVARSSSGAGFLAAPPEIVIKALIEQKQRELTHTERSLGRLLQRARDALARRAKREHIVEVITGREAVTARFDQLQRTAQHEVLAFITVECVRLAAHSALEHASSRDVQVRTVYDQHALDSPDAFDFAAQQVAADVQVRIATGLPVTVMIFDRKTALMLDEDQGTSRHGALVLGASALLDALLTLFETVWSRSAPAPRSRAGDRNDAAASEQDYLVTMLAAGLKDEAIARRLGLSTRTLDRRVSALMQSLEATTRFQAGWLAAHHAGEPPG